MFMSNYMPVWEKLPWNWSTIGIIHFFHYLFCGNINQEHNFLPDCAFGPFTYVYYENCMSGFSTFVLNVSNSAILCLDQCQIKIFCSAQNQLSLVPTWLAVHELSMLAAVDLHVSNMGKWGVWAKTSKWKDQNLLIY